MRMSHDKVDEGVSRVAYFCCGAICNPLSEASVSTLTPSLATTLQPVFFVMYQHMALRTLSNFT